MTLQEFIDKNFEKKKGNVCVECGKKIKKSDEVSDMDGNLYHKECFDKAVGNDELKKRREDNQLPYDN